MPSVLVVGAGLGGLRVVESLRQAGFSDQVTVVGDEPYWPYNRPPLSKEALAHGVAIDALEFRRKPITDDVEWRLGCGVVGVDLAAGRATLADGSAVPFDALAVASGLRPRRLPLAGPMRGRHQLRTVTDAERLRAALEPGTTVVILGAGFVGCEVAASARAMGCIVHVVADGPEPLIRPLGASLGAALRRRHEGQGVHFHLGHTLDAVLGDEQVEGVALSDGTELPASVLLEAVGAVPNVEWLDGNGLDLSDGVLVDSAMQVRGSPRPMVAVGDVARHPNALFGPVARRVEHWNIPTETGRRAGRTLAALLRGEEPDDAPFTAMPAFWSDQYALQIQSFGMPDLGSTVELVSGSLDGPCIVEYRRDDDLVGVVGVNRTADLAPYVERLRGRHA